MADFCNCFEGLRGYFSAGFARILVWKQGWFWIYSQVFLDGFEPGFHGCLFGLIFVALGTILGDNFRSVSLVFNGG